MASVDERIVAISFENSRFQTNVATTMASLGQLDKAIADIGKVNGLASLESSSSKVTFTGPMSAVDKLKTKLGEVTAGTTFSDMEKSADKVELTGPMTALDRLKAKLGFTTAGTTFSDMERAADGVSFSGLTKAIDGIGGHFSALTAVASVALGNLTAVAAQKGAAILNSFTLAPVAQGFHDYETKINAIQTILANTGLKGPQGLAKVQGALQQLNRYANLTVFNFADMAKNIGTFTAAGVKLGPAVSSIKGIANLSALSGSSSEQASSAMYQLSQAIAAGQVHLQDWNSVVNAGIGGSVFQKALLRTGQAMGTISDGAVKIDKATGKATINGQSFRESLQTKPGEQSWLTSDVLVKTLGQFTGDMTDAQLAADGFNKSQIKAIQATAKTAVSSATKIKTFSQLMQALKEEVGSAWSQVFGTLFGNINQSKKLFSELHTFLEKGLTGPILAFNKVLKEWSALGGRTELIKGLKSAFADLSEVLSPIRLAFRDIFPKKSANDLLSMTKNFKSFADSMRPSKQTVEDIRKTFDGLFAVLHIGWTILKDVIGVLGELIHVAAPAGGGLLSMTAGLGDFFVSLDKVVSKGKGIDELFKGMGSFIKAPLKLIKELGSAIKNLFTGDIGGGAGALSGSVGNIGKSLGPLSGILNAANRAWEGFLHILGQIKKAISPTLDKIADVVGHFGDIVSNGIKNADYSKVFTAVQTVLIGGIFLAIKKAIGGGAGGLSVDFGQGLLKNLSETFEALTGNLKAMQKTLQAATLLEIAAAIGILAGAVLLLSTVDPHKLGRAMGAVAVGMGELVAAMTILNKAAGGLAFVRMPFIAGSMVLLSTAIVILAGAVKIFSTLSWEDLGKGLAGVAGSLAAIGLATKLMDGPKLIVTGAALIPLAFGLNILAVAVKIFATLSFGQIVKGLTAMAGALTIISVTMKAMPADLPLVGAGLIIVSVGLTALAVAVSAFGHLKLLTLVKGIGAIAAALVIIGIALEAFPPTLGLQAAALILVAAGLSTLAVAIGLMGTMQIGTLVKGILGMGAALVVLGLGLTAMDGTLPGSIALLAAAAAFAILAPALGLLGVMPWGVILKGLGAMALTLGVLAVVGLVASAPLIALGVAIAALGLGLAAVGAAVYLFAKGISLLSDTSTKALAALIGAIAAFIAVFPQMVINFVKGIVEILSSIVKIAPKIIDGLLKIFSDLLDGIIKIAPKLAETISVLITNIVKLIDANAGPILDAGYHMLLAFLQGLAQNIGPITNAVANIIAGFLKSLANDIPKIVTAGVTLLVKFLDGIIKNIPRIIGVVAKLVTTWLNAISKNVGRIIRAGGNLMIRFISAIISEIPKMIEAGVQIITNFLRGIGKSIPRLITTAVDTATKFINALAKAMVRLVNVGFNAMINFMNGLARAIRRNSKRLSDAGYNIASAIVSGIVNGLGNLAGHVVTAVENLAKSIPGKFLDVLGIGSPSKVMMEIGEFAMKGLALGIQNKFPEVDKTLANSAKATVKSAKKEFGKIPGALGDINSQPVIRPILDLSHVKKHASELNNLMPSPVITAKISTDQATRISAQQAALDTGKAVQGGTGPVTNVEFHQTNNSPDPLPAIEIYRQTNNQISRLKSLVGTGPRG